jgi:hypothetical protein
MFAFFICYILYDLLLLAETKPFNVPPSLFESSNTAAEPTVSMIGIPNLHPDNGQISRALLVKRYCILITFLYIYRLVFYNFYLRYFFHRPQDDLDDLVNLINTTANVFELGQRNALEPLAKAYLDYVKDQAFSNFHGLYDYYMLIKRLSLDKVNAANIQMALARNFGGTGNDDKLFEKYFGNILKMFNNHDPWFYKQIPVNQLINSNLSDPDARHLMVIGKSDLIVSLLTYQLRIKNLDPVVILGSQFFDDQDNYFYNVLNRIMVSILFSSKKIYYLIFNLF